MANPKYNRSMDIAALSGANDSDALTYNFQAGAKKVMNVGPRLIPIPTSSTSWTTNVSSAAVGLPALGMNLAVYNNAGTAGSITIGKTPSLSSLAIGAVDSVGNVGVACPPNSWTYLSMGVNQWIISSAATLITYIVEDSTTITRES